MYTVHSNYEQHSSAVQVAFLLIMSAVYADDIKMERVLVNM